MSCHKKKRQRKLVSPDLLFPSFYNTCTRLRTGEVCAVPRESEPFLRTLNYRLCVPWYSTWNDPESGASIKKVIKKIYLWSLHTYTYTYIYTQIYISLHWPVPLGPITQTSSSLPPEIHSINPNQLRLTHIHSNNSYIAKTYVKSLPGLVQIHVYANQRVLRILEKRVPG